MTDLGSNGLLHPLLKAVQRDRDLSLEIRGNYFNVYFRGFSIAKVDRKENGAYRNTIHRRFCPKELGSPTAEVRQADETQLDQQRKPVNAPYNMFEWSPANLEQFLKWLPFVKQRVLELRGQANELEVEQWLIRAASREELMTGCKVEYLAIDRQCAQEDEVGKPDVFAFFWPHIGRSKNSKASLAVIEVKHLLNPETEYVHEQLWRYHRYVCKNMNELAKELETIARQKVKLGLLRKPIGDLKLNLNPGSVKYVAAFADFNPFSKYMVRLKNHLREMSLKGDEELSFVRQFELFQIGFGLWASNGKSGTELTKA